MAPRWALIAISSLAAPLDSTGGQEVDEEFSTVDSRMRLLSCLINAFYMYLSTCQLLPVLLKTLKMLFGTCNVGRLADLVVVLSEREKEKREGGMR